MWMDYDELSTTQGQLTMTIATHELWTYYNESAQSTHTNFPEPFVLLLPFFFFKCDRHMDSMYPSYGTILILINFQLSVNIHSTFVGIKKRKTAFPIEFVQFIEPLNRVIFGKKEARFILDVQHHRSFPFILYDWHKFDIRDSIVHAYSFDSRYVGQPLHLL